VSRKWTVPTDNTDSTPSANASQPPYYVLAAPPLGGFAKPEFQLTSPMNVNNSTYLSAYISANSDPSNYGKLTVLQLPPGSNVVQGPEQVYNLITTDNTVRRDSLYATGGNGANVLHGNLLTLPLDKSFLYVEPLYTVSSTSSGAYPSLQRVIVVYGNKIGYGADLAAALSDFEPGHHTGQTLALSGGGNGSTGSGGGTSSSPPTGTPSSSRSTPASGTGGSVTLAQIDQAILDLQAAYQTGDPAKVGAAEAKLQQLIEKYKVTSTPSSGTSKPGSPTPSRSPSR